ncbi:MAG: hypothetical protein PVF34_08235 [Gammaproteobacteria bacterium]|jgi:hypothetical protein
MIKSHSSTSQLVGHHTIDYIAHSAVGERRVHVEFAGRYGGEPVIWQATIVALGVGTSRQYIDVQIPTGRSPRIEVGLPLDCIREPDILKTMMMIRHYKKLSHGRHEFGGIAR